MAGHVREFDGLRALSVLAVMATHWGPLFFNVTLPVGGMGVLMFFTISGFLITDILLSSRSRVEAGGSALAEWRTFYARRTLRIFPAYYLALFVAFMLGVPTVVDPIWWHLSYTSNIYFAGRGAFTPVVGHLWSLSVEEQFYVIWPFLILLTPRKWLLPTIIAAICVAPAWRAAMSLDGAGPARLSGQTPACLDALGGGALLAWLQRRRELGLWTILTLGLAGTILLGVALWARLAYGELQMICALSFGLAMSMCAVSALAAILRWRGHWALAPLRWGPVAYLGTISYGLYLYHPFVAEAVAHVLPSLEKHSPAYVAANFAATLAVAAASWKLFEAPINRLKGFFPYRSGATGALAPAT
jgi:peptidoglycan/LPS O-acetylase OafA/YrhL